jgi:hypothetical protein
MVELALILISFGMIWGAWGFWIFLAVFVGKVILVYACKPQYSFEKNWGTLIGNIAILALGLCAVNSIWANPIITAIAVGVAVIGIFIELK